MRARPCVALSVLTFVVMAASSMPVASGLDREGVRPRGRHTTSSSPSPAPTPIPSPTPSTSASPSASASSPTSAGRSGATQPRWNRRIDRLVAGIRMSVSIGYQGRFLYRTEAAVPRIPASNEKLMLSMALLDALGPDATIPTRVRTTAEPVAGVVKGGLWIVGRGDPEVGRGAIADLAHRIVAAGITRIRGRVMGSTEYFRRERWALGWRSHYTRNDVPFPTALAFRGNVGPSGGHIDDPERRAAAALTHRLRRLGVQVSGRPGMGSPTDPLTTVATVRSKPLSVLLREMDVDSLNFYADELEKVLGASIDGAPATFEMGGGAIEAYEHAQGVGGFEHHDGSGLSYADRVTTGGVVRLLWAADDATWGPVLRGALAHAGQGTLIHRLKGVRVRAKTGTLTAISALSGWVWLENEGAWGTFSILSRGLSKTHAMRIEDAIVTTVSRNAP